MAFSHTPRVGRRGSAADVLCPAPEQSGFNNPEKSGAQMSIKRYGVEGGMGTGGQHLPFARAVEADGWLYVSGQVPMVDGEVVVGNIVVQSQQAIRNLFSILTEAGAGPAHV